MKAYKIVRVTTKELVSICLMGLIYKVGQKTTPKIGKLFVFKAKKHAIDFYERLTDDKYLVFSCEVDSLSIGWEMSGRSRVDFVEKFWQNTLPCYECINTPKGTYFCNEVTLIEQVYPKD